MRRQFNTKTSEREDTAEARLDGFADALRRPPPAKRGQRPDRRKLTPAQIERLRELRPKHPVYELAEMFQVSMSCVYEMARDIKGPPPRRRQRREPFPQDLIDAIRCERPTASLAALACRYHTTASRITEFCRGIKGPPPTRKPSNITPEMRDAMRQDRRGGLTLQRIAIKYDVSLTTAWNITSAKNMPRQQW